MSAEVAPFHRREYTRRQFMTYEAVIRTGTTVFTAMEAVASWAIEHPEVDMEERMTWPEWEAES